MVPLEFFSSVGGEGLKLGLAGCAWLCFFYPSKERKETPKCVSFLWNTQKSEDCPVPAVPSGLESWNFDFFVVKQGEPEAVNTHCALRSPKAQAEKIPCACGYIKYQGC